MRVVVYGKGSGKGFSGAQALVGVALIGAGTVLAKAGVERLIGWWKTRK